MSATGSTKIVVFARSFTPTGEPIGWVVGIIPSSTRNQDCWWFTDYKEAAEFALELQAKYNATMEVEGFGH